MHISSQHFNRIIKSIKNIKPCIYGYGAPSIKRIDLDHCERSQLYSRYYFAAATIRQARTKAERILTLYPSVSLVPPLVLLNQGLYNQIASCTLISCVRGCSRCHRPQSEEWRDGSSLRSQASLCRMAGHVRQGEAERQIQL